jgi:ABC-type bacteriocin/lantibiotic exporter with double-glycine peptidase domain
VVTCVARFHPVKDHPTLVRAFADVARADEHATLLLVGGGDDAPLRALVGELGITDRVVFAGVRRPRQGDVSRDGSPIERLSADQRFDEVMLLRAGGVIQGTVDDNLTLGRRLSPPEAWAALDAVGLSDAVRALSDGLSASLGAEGEPLSESQIVDLLVARATVSGARLLVVDGLLDGLPPAHRDRLLQLLTQLPCTLIVLTEDDAVARATGRSLEWTAEGWR